jgi:3-deoxy-7-phosphoheptulonate synthase
MTPTSNLHIVTNTALPPPATLQRELPRTSGQSTLVSSSRSAVSAILRGDDSRFLVVVGPCSIHDPEAGLEYARRLANLARELEDRLFIVMRVYFEKPRTTVGWKGLIMDPHLDGSNDIPAGLRLARRILGEVLDLGLPTATELLDPITPQYIADLLTWAAIGARTTESQTHRQMASGLSMPVGFKNTTGGAVSPAINAVKAAVHPQTFLGINEDGAASVVTTTGNPDSHIILRGGDEGPNCHREAVEKSLTQLQQANLPGSVIIDASHANCGKDHLQMPEVFRSILQLRASGLSGIRGAMLESNLGEGSQPFPRPLPDLLRGVSITDACIGWETTETLLREAAAILPG